MMVAFTGSYNMMKNAATEAQVSKRIDRIEPREWRSEYI